MFSRSAAATDEMPVFGVPRVALQIFKSGISDIDIDLLKLTWPDGSTIMLSTHNSLADGVYVTVTYPKILNMEASHPFQHPHLVLNP